jgi:hypothetical protein
MKLILIASMSALCAGLAYAGTAEVSFVNPELYRDGGRFVGEAEKFRTDLAGHLKQLAARQLPDGQELTIEVLDIELAGEPRISGRLDNPRVLRGGADWPRIELSYTLRAGGQVLASGQEVVQDIAYMNTSLALTSSQSLPYEKRMLTRWFNQRFGAGTPH